MKNILVYVVIALLFAPSVSNARWGTEFASEFWKMDGKELLTSKHTLEVKAADNGDSDAIKVTQGNLGGAARFFVEANSRFRLGVALGYGVMPAVSFNARATYTAPDYDRMNLENKTTYIPLDLYLKYTTTGGKFSWFGGGGADYIMASTDFKDENLNSGTSQSFTATVTQDKVVPHVQAGCELFLSKWVSLNLSAKYVFSAVLDNLTGKVKEDGVTLAGKYRMIMLDDPPYGEQFGGFRKTSAPLASDERPFKYDLSGLRANVAFRVYFN